MTSSCMRTSLDWTVGKSSSLKGWSSCPGKWWNHLPCKCSKGAWMWHLVVIFSVEWLSWVNAWTRWYWRSFPIIMILWFYDFLCFMGLPWGLGVQTESTLSSWCHSPKEEWCLPMSGKEGPVAGHGLLVYSEQRHQPSLRFDFTAWCYKRKELILQMKCNTILNFWKNERRSKK